MLKGQSQIPVEDHKLSSSEYPLYVVLNNYNSCTLMELLNFSRHHRLEIGFQTHLNKIVRIGDRQSDKYFVILCDFDRAPSLEGQFLKLKCVIVEYPRLNLETILEKYTFFINSDSLSSKYSISSIYLPENKVNQSMFSKSEPKLIKFISASQLQIAKKEEKTTLFIYKSRYDGQKYTNYFNFLKSLQTNSAQMIFLDTINQYFVHLGQKQKENFCMIISENTAMHLRKYFKKVDDFFVLGESQQTCFPLVRANIAYLTCEELEMNKILIDKFKIKELANIVSVFSEKKTNQPVQDEINNAIEFQEFQSSPKHLQQLLLESKKSQSKLLLETAESNFKNDQQNQSQLQKVYKIIKKFKSFAIKSRKQSPGKFKVTKNIKYRKNVLFDKMSMNVPQSTI